MASADCPDKYVLNILRIGLWGDAFGLFYIFTYNLKLLHNQSYKLYFSGQIYQMKTNNCWEIPLYFPVDNMMTAGSSQMESIVWVKNRLF